MFLLCDVLLAFTRRVHACFLPVLVFSCYVFHWAVLSGRGIIPSSDLNLISTGKESGRGQKQAKHGRLYSKQVL